MTIDEIIHEMSDIARQRIEEYNLRQRMLEVAGLS